MFRGRIPSPRPGDAHHRDRRRRPAGGQGKDLSHNPNQHSLLQTHIHYLGTKPLGLVGGHVRYTWETFSPGRSNVSSRPDRIGPAKPPRPRDQPLPAAAQAQSGRLVAMGPEALAEAKRTGKPILLSVGYAACHWCHVMAHESFEDDATAAVMNELFVNIKVDREERPDIDQIYMAALHHLGEQGGWPLTMFLTPDGEPVWGGTYFPQDLALRPARLSSTCCARSRGCSARSRPRSTQNRDALMARLRRARAAGQPRGDRRAPSSTSIARAARAARSIRSTAAARRAEISASRAVRAAVARRPAHRRATRFFDAGRAHARPHLRGRHLRSSRRRLLALLGRRALAGAAFREDALRQCAAARAAGARLSAQPASRSIARARARRSAGSRAR